MPDVPTEPRGERELIRRLRGRLSGAGRAAAKPGFGDDMAGIDPIDPALLWTVDMLMDGVDFDSAEHGWELVGRKALAVSLSDCAAMAAQPVSALCALALSSRLTLTHAEQIVRGAHELGLRFGCPVVGGDTNSWDAPTVVSITVAARMPADVAPVLRSGARPGDRIWLTGPCGGSILGRHLTFEPRVELALRLARDLRPHAMIDISDGVAIDLDRVCEASCCGATIDATLLEAAVHDDARELSRRDGRAATEHALSDGEDFELIVILPREVGDDQAAAFGLLPLGEMSAPRGLWLRRPDGREDLIKPAGWEHFR
jgi:thiamine-monophosphate kinase